MWGDVAFSLSGLSCCRELRVEGAVPGFCGVSGVGLVDRPGFEVGVEPGDGIGVFRGVGDVVVDLEACAAVGRDKVEEFLECVFCVVGVGCVRDLDGDETAVEDLCAVVAGFGGGGDEAGECDGLRCCWGFLVDGLPWVLLVADDDYC